jgi:Superfamily II DNA and RNA helicases
MSSKFFTNESEKSVFDKFKGIIENMSDLHALHAVVGYFRSSGYFALQPYLKDINEIKILVGINADQMFAEAQRKGLLFFTDDKRTKEEFLKWFIQDIREAKYSAEVEAGILQFIEDLISGKIEVRAHSSKTIHAKFYLFLPKNHTPHSDGWVIMGSSNLTSAGLGIRKSPNYELNVALKDYDDVEFTKREFAKLWKDSTSILPADIQQFKEKTHIGQTFTPFEIYIKFLIEYFGKNIDYDPDTVGDLPTTYKKLSYQIDAVNQGFQMLLDHNGFFLADVVGLGKTVVAAMIAKRFLIANGSLNTKILVIYPPALEKNWKTTFRQFGITKHAKFITNGRLEKILNGSDLDYWPKEEYDLILVDEAHRYRNHASQMFDNLQRICKAPRTGEGLIPGNKKKVILISATPLNNRPQDLYYQLLLFQDARKSTLPVTNLQSFFGPIIREYKEIMKQDKPDLARIRELYEKIREKIVEPITVRRTRNDLKKYPKYIEDLKEQGIEFPEIAPPRAKEYRMNAGLSELFYHTIFYLTDEDKINYFRYQAVRFLKPEIQESFGYEKATLVSKSLAGIMKTLMVKRLESSFEAFRKSLRNLLNSTRRMIEMFETGRVLIAPDLKINDLQEKGYSYEEIEKMILELTAENPRNNVFGPEDFEPEFLAGLRKDEQLLNELCQEWAHIEQDPKLDTFFKTIDEELFRSDINPTSQLVVFTESKDTADYLQEKIEARLATKVLNVSSENRNKLFDIIQENFDANYTGEHKNDYKILITTDVLAEGVNLHRANVIVNYDTPWNATRLMQRIGRVNRIGSVAGVIYNYNFYPSQQGDEEIRLYNNALVKLQGFHSAFGEDAQIFTHEELVEQFELFKEGVEGDEDKRLYYLKKIRDFKNENPREFRRIKQFPLKARTARDLKRAKKADLAPSTVVFLQSPYKTEFYQVNEKLQVVPLTFVEAAQIFEAAATEPAFDLPAHHYEHVQAALQVFEQDFFGSATEIVTTTDKADGISRQAQKFLRDFRQLSKREEIKTACTNLLELIERGVYTPLPNEIKKLRQQVDKRKILYGEAENLLIKLAAKYDALAKTDETENGYSSQNSELDFNIEPEIVLSETFFE